jgi:DNA polymerase-3 subunit gamma/tau
VRRVWPEVLAAAKERKKRTAALLVSATVRAVENDTLVLAIGTAPLARLLSEQSNTDVIAESLHAVLGVRWRVRCEHGDGGSPPPSSGRAEPARTTPAPAFERPAPSAARAAAAPPAPEAAAQRRPTRPPPVRRSTSTDEGVPLPPEPPDEEAPPEDDEEAMIAEVAADTTGSAPRRDPIEAAMELLSSQLGAKTLDQGRA